MGDRANIILTNSSCFPHPLWLYTHWAGTELPETLKAALKRGKGRWRDGSYLARVIFCEMVGENTQDETGFGISTKLCDNEHPLLVVDIGKQEVRIIKTPSWDSKADPLAGEVLTTHSFEEFIALPEDDGEEQEED